MFSCTTGTVYGPEDGKCDATANEADHHGDFQKAKEQVAIYGLMVENPRVGDFGKLPNPTKETLRETGGAFLLTKGGQKSPGFILARVSISEDKEENKVDKRYQ